ncbi:hypothetical protein [Streptomyces sp. NPDC001889]
MNWTALAHIPEPRRPVTDEPAWRYPSSCAGGGGSARLRVWRTGGGGRLAVVTELGAGVSVTNAAEEITAALTARFPGPLTVFEHWRAGDGAAHDRLDQVHAPAGARPRWRPVWPLAPAHPDHAAHREWMRTAGAVLLTTRP